MPAENKIESPRLTTWVALLLGVVLGVTGYWIYSNSRAAMISTSAVQLLGPVDSSLVPSLVGEPICPKNQYLETRDIKLKVTDLPNQTPVGAYGVCRAIPTGFVNAQKFVALPSGHFTEYGKPKCPDGHFWNDTTHSCQVVSVLPLH